MEGHALRGRLGAEAGHAIGSVSPVEFRCKMGLAQGTSTPSAAAQSVIRSSPSSAREEKRPVRVLDRIGTGKRVGLGACSAGVFKFDAAFAPPCPAAGDLGQPDQPWGATARR